MKLLAFTSNACDSSLPLCIVLIVVGSGVGYRYLMETAQGIGWPEKTCPDLYGTPQAI